MESYTRKRRNSNDGGAEQIKVLSPRLSFTLSSFSTSRSTLLKMLAALFLSLALCASALPIQDFDVEKV